MPEFVDEIVAPHFLEYLDAKVRLDALSKKVQLDLSRLDYPKEDWVPPFQHHLGTSVVDVVIVGAGQGGLAAGLALWRERIRNILIIDQAKEGSEGPWMTFARMKTLRTPKYLTGPDTGIPDLTFNAWYSARFSSPEWSDVLRIPREMWMVYLQWFRASLDLPIKNRTRLISVVPDVPGCLALTLERPNGIQKVFTRKLILANGLEGSGRWHVPPDLSAHLPKNLWMHTSDIKDFSTMQGKRIGILGVGASAVDSAATAAEAGASQVDLFYRRPLQPYGERRKWVENNGFLSHFASLPDAVRWRGMHVYLRAGTPAPKWSMERLLAQPNVQIHQSEGWSQTRLVNDAVEVTTSKSSYEFDCLIFGTGIQVDLEVRPELSAFAGKIASWGDCYDAPELLRDRAMSLYPYLGLGAELTERVPGMAPHLAAIHVFNWGATLSMGISSASITGMKFGLRRIIAGITNDFYKEIAEAHIASFPKGPD